MVKVHQKRSWLVQKQKSSLNALARLLINSETSGQGTVMHISPLQWQKSAPTNDLASNTHTVERSTC